MAKKENFQEYVTRIQNEIAGIESKIEAEELKKLQLEHKMQRLQNVTEYKVNKSKKARVSRLITRGAAIECICKDVELLDKAEFFLLAERIFRIRIFEMRSQKWLLEEENVQRQERQSFKVPSKT